MRTSRRRIPNWRAKTSIHPCMEMSMVFRHSLLCFVEERRFHQRPSQPHSSHPKAVMEPLSHREPINSNYQPQIITVEDGARRTPVRHPLQCHLHWGSQGVHHICDSRWLREGATHCSWDAEIIQQRRTDGNKGRFQHGKQRWNLLFFVFICTEVQVEIKNSASSAGISPLYSCDSATVFPLNFLIFRFCDAPLSTKTLTCKREKSQTRIYLGTIIN